MLSNWMRLRYVAKAARFAPPYVLAVLQPGAAATWRSVVLEDVECMYRLLAPKLGELGFPRETPTRWEEFMKRWRGQRQLMVTRVSDKRMQTGDGEEGGGLSD